MSDSRPSVTIRMPARLKTKIEERAKRNIRSLNAEIIYLLGFAVDEVDDWEHWKGAQDIEQTEEEIRKESIQQMIQMDADARVAEASGILSDHDLIRILVGRLASKSGGVA
ncbi:Arc family DNA-binding protein [Acetobacter okinawensis]|uniref:Arc family DNA-binding protein n=1 Tax=Acetobacter okinawensis TaxID=1076594 RepID=UPI00046ED7A2|nr:Arc family DNA-binding protein [Acetobacter okinawensis]